MLNKIRLSNLSGLVRTVSQVVGGTFCDFKFLVVDKGIIDKVVTLRVNFPCALLNEKVHVEGRGQNSNYREVDLFDIRDISTSLH